MHAVQEIFQEKNYEVLGKHCWKIASCMWEIVFFLIFIDLDCWNEPVSDVSILFHLKRKILQRFRSKKRKLVNYAETDEEDSYQSVCYLSVILSNNEEQFKSTGDLADRDAEEFKAFSEKGKKFWGNLEWYM